MSDPARRRATYQDVMDAPPNMRAEILLGELHLTPRPQFDHASVSSAAGADLHVTFGRRGGSAPGGWVILDEPELHLGGSDPQATVAVPDLAGWRRERFRRPKTGGHTIPADWVCEVLSPGARNVRRDRIIKTAVYHDAGIAWLWIVDPAARTIEVFRSEPPGYLLLHTFAGDDREARIPPFESVPLDISVWWEDLGEEE